MSTSAKSELEIRDVTVRNPNLILTEDVVSLCAAAKAAAARNSDWTNAERGEFLGLRGRLNRKYVQFNVTYGGGTYVYKLTANGVVIWDSSPIRFVTLTTREMEQMKRVLEDIAKQA